MFVEFIQEEPFQVNCCRWAVSGLTKIDQSQASKYLVGKGINQMTFLPRMSQSERVLQPARLASD
jgi:hypothetical protein